MTIAQRRSERPRADLRVGQAERPAPRRTSPRLPKMPSLSDQVRGHLLTELTSGRLRPGDRINEAEMSRSLGISRNPIREAISGLAQRGFLVPAPRRGHFLRGFTIEDINDVYAFRICVETFALREALPKMSDVDRRGFEKLLARMISAARAERLDELYQADMRFHRRICELSRSRKALWAHEGIDTEVRMLMASVDLDRESPLDTAMIHEPIATAIVSGDVERSIAALDAHLRRTWADVVAKYEEIGRRGRAPGYARASKPAPIRDGLGKETSG